MSHPASAALERRAPEIAARLIAVADDLIDPAVYLAADGQIFIVEHLTLIATMATATEESEPLQPEAGTIVVAVAYDEKVSRKRVPDPRVHPDRWPWVST